MFKWFLLFLYCFTFLISCKPQQDSTEIQEPLFKKEGSVVIYRSAQDSIVFDAEFAETEDETATGLMNRHHMDNNQGMFFVFNIEKELTFWMKNTYIPLDIIFINSDLKIVRIAENAEPLNETMIPSEKAALYAFEINGGLCRQWKIEAGQKIRFIR